MVESQLLKALCMLIVAKSSAAYSKLASILHCDNIGICFWHHPAAQTDRTRRI